MKQILKHLIPQSIKNLLKPLLFRRILTNPYLTAKAIGKVDEIWRRRIDDVLSCPDNKFINRVQNAGEITGHLITMHNGVKVCANGYYGSGILNMLIENKGVHEPQEERAFDEILKFLPNEPTMLELGAYWGFYSLSLLNTHPKATCYLVEPDPGNIISGEINFKANNREGIFEQAFVSDIESLHSKVKTISVDGFCSRRSIDHLHILHADIQGAETAMLRGASRMLSEGRVDYVFISTHTNDLHQDCLQFLQLRQYNILAAADLDQTYSCDGLIVAKRHNLTQPTGLEISRKNVQQSKAANS